MTAAAMTRSEASVSGGADAARPCRGSGELHTYDQHDSHTRRRLMLRSARLSLLTVSLAIICSACRDPEAPLPQTVSASVALRAAQAPDRLDGAGNRQANRFTDSALFARGARGDTQFIVGVKLPGTNRGNWHGERFVTPAQQLAAERTFASLHPGVRIVSRDTLLTAVVVHVPNSDALGRIRQLPTTDYVEPNLIDDTFAMQSSDGCTDWPNPAFPVLQDSYGEYYSSPYDEEHIRQAWAVTQGFGVSLGLADAVIDSTLSEFFARPDDPMSGFTGGLSAGRTYADSRIGTVCTHAARMGMLMAGPRNQRGTNGVAYRANFVSGGALNGPLIQFGPAMSQVAYGVRLAADETNTAAKHVVALAFGQYEWSNLLADEINRLYYQKDIMFVGAAGTDVPAIAGGSDAVVFPASMTEVFAVSATTMSGQRDPQSSGNAKVELTAITPNTVGMSSAGFFSQLSNSSSATAVISGVAALVRARFPEYNNAQVRYQLTRRTLAACSGRQDWKPVVDALAAVGSFCGTHLIGTLPTVTFQCKYSPPQTVTVYTDVLIGQNPFGLAWSTGSTQSSATYTVSPPQGAEGLWYNTTPVGLSATDPMTGETRSASDFILAKVLGGTKCRF